MSLKAGYLDLAKTLVASVLVMSLHGCTAEDWTGCDVSLDVRFSFVHNPSQTERFSREVHSIDLYVFDADGVFVKRQHAESAEFGDDYVMNVPLDDEGKYTVIALGNIGEEFMIGQPSRGGQPAEELEPGATEVTEFRLMYEPGTGTPVSGLDDIFHAGAYLAQVTSDGPAECKVYFIKNTKKLDISIIGLDKVVGTDGGRPLYPQVTVHASAANGIFDSNNGIDPQGGRITYAPYERSEQGTQLNVNMSVLRFTVDTVMPFEIRDGGRAVYAADLVGEIRKNPKYTSDSELDREDTFRIVISFETNGSFTVEVNGWKTSESSGNIG